MRALSSPRLRQPPHPSNGLGPPDQENLSLCLSLVRDPTILGRAKGGGGYGLPPEYCRKRPPEPLVARAIRNAIRANRFARIIRNRNPYFYSASDRFAQMTRISDSRESPDSRESCESIRANHATKPQSNESYERENRTISTVLWVHNKLPQSTVKVALPSNER